MAYATLNELADRLGPELLLLVADDDGDGAADEPVIEAALTDAAGEIDRALAGRYATPVADPPDLLRRWCIDLAIERLFVRHRDALPAEHAALAALARRALAAIADGLAGLAGARPLARDHAAAGTHGGEGRVFDADSLADF
ncbi:MAG: hypothetical protein BWZ08_00352 [candidate division BRC1 bacterium ADurb.BinA292]|nr:MAG: hypothetical protein BWZ08_00352 [candidate division BRC1 bacterium ADurb.BinA292]